MNEEIVFGMGLDTTAFGYGLRSAKSMLVHSAEEMKGAFVGGIKEMFAPVAGAFAASKLFEMIKGAAEYAKQIKVSAEETGTTTSFIQGLGAAALKLGVSSDKASESLAILSRKVGEARSGSEEAQKVFAKWGIEIDGLSTEQIFYKIADAMKATADPSERSAMAFELMGRGAKEMAVALPIGAEAMRQLVESSSKLSDAEIEKLHDIDARLEEIGRKWKIIWGTVVASLTSLPAGGISEGAIKARSEEIFRKMFKSNPRYFGVDDGSSVESHLGLAQLFGIRDKAIQQLKNENEEKQSGIKITENETKLIARAAEIRNQASMVDLATASKIAALKEKADDLEDEIDQKMIDGVNYGQQLVDLETTKKTILEEQKRLRKEINDQEERARKNLEEAVEKMRHMNKEAEGAKESDIRAERDLTDAKEGQTKMSLHELATTNLRFGGTLGHDQWLSQQIELKDRQREWNRLHGNDIWAQDRLNEENELRKQLSGNVQDKDRRDPWLDLKDHIKKANDNWDFILLKMKTEGIPIDPKNAK